MTIFKGINQSFNRSCDLLDKRSFEIQLSINNPVNIFLSLDKLKSFRDNVKFVKMQ